MILIWCWAMRHRLLGILIAFGVFGCATVASYMVLDHFYGTARVYAPRLENVVWENVEEWSYGREISGDNVGFDVSISPDYQSAPPGTDLSYNVTVTNVGADADTYHLQAVDAAGWDLEISDELVQVAGGAHENVRLAVGIPELSEYGENDKIVLVTRSLRQPQLAAGAWAFARSGEFFAADVPIPLGAGTGLQPVITYEKPVAVLPIAATIGVTVGLMVFAVWIGYRRMWGDATSTLLERGLHDMTVKDVEIVGQIIELKEFTIPQLMKLTNTSKITVWRTVQKLVKQELVQPTEQTRPAANGLGGRGKPSRVYKYVGGPKT